MELLLTEDQKLFLDFIRKCFAIDPNERMTCEEAINHLWLEEELRNSNLCLNYMGQVPHIRLLTCDSQSTEISKPEDNSPFSHAISTKCELGCMKDAISTQGSVGRVSMPVSNVQSKADLMQY